MKLAYRDHDRAPVIYLIKEMAKRHYDLDIEVVHIFPNDDFEAALFNGACDVIIEHTEYLFAEVAKGAKVTFFCAPLLETGLEIVTRPELMSLDALEGQRIAQPEGSVATKPVWARQRCRTNDSIALPNCTNRKSAFPPPWCLRTSRARTARAASSTLRPIAKQTRCCTLFEPSGRTTCHTRPAASTRHVTREQWRMS